MSVNVDSGNESIDGYVLQLKGLKRYAHERQTIESVEQEVERLLDEDSLASEVKYGALTYLP
jgi:TATA-binding protein-associated factor Taf7